jgi:hypothetical protein
MHANPAGKPLLKFCCRRIFPLVFIFLSVSVDRTCPSKRLTKEITWAVDEEVALAALRHHWARTKLNTQKNLLCRRLENYKRLGKTKKSELIIRARPNEKRRNYSKEWSFEPARRKRSWSPKEIGALRKQKFDWLSVRFQNRRPNACLFRRKCQSKGHQNTLPATRKGNR